MVTVGLLILFWILGLVADYLVARVPFEYEQSLAKPFIPHTVTEGKIPSYLQTLTTRLAAQMSLPEGMTIQVHYVDEDVINASATLGGQILVYRGLLERLPNENALAMVIAHEIAHIKLRHPLRSLGRGAVLAISIGVLSGSSGNSLGDFLVGEAGALTSLGFSRDQEKAADAEGLHAVAALYGHASGAIRLFQVFLEEEEKQIVRQTSFDFLNTHPLSQDRIESMTDLAQQQNWSLSSKTTPLPSFITE